MPILIDQLNINARIVPQSEKEKPKPGSCCDSSLGAATGSPKMIMDLLQRAIDAKRW